MYAYSDMECDRYTFLSFQAIFWSFMPPPPNNPENKTFEKMEKNPGDIIILHMSTINKNHVMYDS